MFRVSSWSHEEHSNFTRRCHPIIRALLRTARGWAAQHEHGSHHPSWQGGLPWGSSLTARANGYFSLLSSFLTNTSSTRNSHFVPIFQLSWCSYCPSCLPAENPSRPPYQDNFPLLPAWIKKLHCKTFHFKKHIYWVSFIEQISTFISHISNQVILWNNFY